MTLDLAIIGGGAAGFFAAISAAEARAGMTITIFEKGSAVLGKVLVSGGGRCNVTNALSDPARLAEFYPRGGKALRGALTRFGPPDTVQWFEQRGVRLKTEPDGRMFPLTDSSQTIIDCLTAETQRLGIEVRTRTPVERVVHDGELFHLHLRGGERVSAGRVLLATGGSKAGLDLAREMGHTITPLAPSLFTFVVQDPRISGLAGLSVGRVTARLPEFKLSQQGPLLITHWGLSGPVVLRLSAWGARDLQAAGYRAALELNFHPDHNPETLYQALQAVKANKPRQPAAARDPIGGVPQRLWARLVTATGMGEGMAWGDVSKNRLNALAQDLTRAAFQIAAKGEFKEEFVTCGGVDLKEVDFKTMQSRLTPGLYFAGEVLDVDGLTGGFNFQNAWTTAWLAAQAAAG